MESPGSLVRSRGDCRICRLRMGKREYAKAASATPQGWMSESLADPQRGEVDRAAFCVVG